MNSPCLAGKVIVLVGGTSGIGLSAARVFLVEGARLVVLGRDDDFAEIAHRELGEAARVLRGDAGDPADSDKAIAVAVEAFGRLDGLYHVAGGSGRRQGDGPLESVTDAGWDFTLRQNLNSVFYSNRAAVRQFLRQGSSGSVLNLSSVLAYAPSPTHFATHAYAAAKAGILGLTTAAAAHYAGSNIRFNALAPGLVATPMSERAQADRVVMEFIARKQPLDGGRIARPEDLDAAAVFFLSDASRFVTGQVLAVDGGWSFSEGGTASEPSPSA
jgi:NAD(P)-dependent dehydrogenase (short-subunit alcohol dehydrogenase family)